MANVRKLVVNATIGIGAFATAFIIGWTIARAHGDAKWIQDGDYRSKIDGTLCCGPTDCEPVKRVDIIKHPTGWLYIPTGELIPFRLTEPSVDARFWRCHAPGNWSKTKCFFVPADGSLS